MLPIPHDLSLAPPDATQMVRHKTRAARNIAWIERYCRVPEGRHVGKPIKQHCQINFKAPALDEEGAQLCGTELAPFRKRGGTVQLEIFAAVKMAFLIEMIVYG